MSIPPRRCIRVFRQCTASSMPPCARQKSSPCCPRCPRRLLRFPSSIRTVHRRCRPRRPRSTLRRDQRPRPRRPRPRPRRPPPWRPRPQRHPDAHPCRRLRLFLPPPFPPFPPRRQRASLPRLRLKSCRLLPLRLRLLRPRLRRRPLRGKTRLPGTTETVRLPQLWQPCRRKIHRTPEPRIRHRPFPCRRPKPLQRFALPSVT